MDFDDMLSGEPLEHLVKILQNASHKAIYNAVEKLFCDYSILEIAIETGITNDNEIFANYKDRINTAKQDLAIRLMYDILSQE